MNALHLLTIGLLAGMLVCGCGQKPSAPHGEKHGDAPEFAEGKGLLLPDATQKSIGLEIVEVAETNLATSITAEVQVYREASASDMMPVSTASSSPHAHASGWLNVEQAKQLKVGQSVAIASVPPMEGRLVRIVETTRSSLGRIEALVEIPDPDRRLRIGALLEAAFTGDRAENVTAIPRSALLKTSAGMFVYVSNGKHLLRTPVVTGTASEEFVEIKDGVYAGDMVAKQPVMTLWLAELQFTKAGQGCTHGH